MRFSHGKANCIRKKLQVIEEKYLEVYQVLCLTVPDLVARPSESTEKDLDQYNFWIDSIDEDEAQPLYHLTNKD